MLFASSTTTIVSGADEITFINRETLGSPTISAVISNPRMPASCMISASAIVATEIPAAPALI